jgi:hypothetical protein
MLNALAKELSEDQLDDVFGLQKKWEWLVFVLIPLFLVLKLFVIAGLLDFGCFLFNIKMAFKNILKCVVLSEYVFLIAQLTKSLCLYFLFESYTLIDLNMYYPLSVISLLDYNLLESWFVYPLQVLNLFEVTYWLLLSHSISRHITSFTIGNGLLLVASSYGVGLLIWVVTVMFFTLNLS